MVIVVHVASYESTSSDFYVYILSSLDEVYIDAIHEHHHPTINCLKSHFASQTQAQAALPPQPIAMPEPKPKRPLYRLSCPRWLLL
jgi:hypothetical protein